MNSISFALKILGVAPAALSLLAAASAAEQNQIAPGAASDSRLISGAGEELFRSSKPVALSITICLWSKERPAPLCREVPLTPGVAGLGFEDTASCEAGKDRAVNDWFAEARQVFGFNSGWSGQGYQIKEPRCAGVG